MYRNMLVPLDGSELAECVLPHVESICAGGQAQVVTLITAVEPFQLPSSRFPIAEAALAPLPVAERMAQVRKQHADESESAAEGYLQRAAGRLQCGDARIRTKVVVGKAADAIADFATANEIDLIVIATHGRSGVSRWIWGSTADRILRSACVPVLMVRAPGCVPGLQALK